MKRRLPNWMAGDTSLPQSDKHTNRCAVQPLFATDETAFVRSFSPTPADSAVSAVSELPDGQQIRILRPSQINSILLNIAQEVPTVSNETAITVNNRSGSDLGILDNEQDENGTNQEEDIKVEDDEIALLEQLESNCHGNDTTDRTVDQHVENESLTTSAGPSRLPDVVPHIPAQSEIKTEPVEAKVKVEPPGTVPISPVQTATISSTNTAQRVSCNYGVKCFRY